MSPLGSLQGTHKVVTLRVPGRQEARMLCLIQDDPSGGSAYYVLAECEGSAIRWRSMIRDNSIRRLRAEFIANITSECVVDGLDVETIFLCTAETSKKA
jgi:hypothetical protein